MEIVIAAPDGLPVPEFTNEKIPVTVVRCSTDSPVKLAAAGLSAARGKAVLMTEDHCVPVPGWSGILRGALSDPATVAAGGPLLPPQHLSAFDWAFFMVDFFRYLPPVAKGRVAALSVCNVGYRKSTLESVRAEWAEGFHETRVHDLLARTGDLTMVPNAEVATHRHVARGAGLVERYRFGQLFAAERTRNRGVMRAAFAAGAPLLPLILMSRIARRCLAAGSLSRRFIRSAAYLAALVGAWSLGELVGYATGRPPASTVAASNRSDTTQAEGDFLEA
jgi:hypothetical protein